MNIFRKIYLLVQIHQEEPTVSKGHACVLLIHSVDKLFQLSFFFFVSIYLITKDKLIVYMLIICHFVVTHRIVRNNFLWSKRKNMLVIEFAICMVERVITLLLVLQWCFSQETRLTTPDTIVSNGAFITLYGYSSTVPKLERHTVRSMLQCGHLCLQNYKCVSFNYQFSSLGSGLCELSEQAINSQEERETLAKMPGLVFVQIARKDLVRAFVSIVIFLWIKD